MCLDALHLSIIHDEIPRVIAICAYDYKFTAYSLQDFDIDDEVIVFIPLPRLPLGTVNKLHV